MVNKNEFNKYLNTISYQRLSSLIFTNEDSEESIIKRYIDNIKISQAFYPELSLLEITLRNSIDYVFKIQFGEDWIEQEIKLNKLLSDYDYKTLVEAYNSAKKECHNKSKQFSYGSVIANLNFGFWTNLCSSKYNTKFWTKKGFFKDIFVNYPKNKQQQIHYISNLLNSIRKLRNKIFHYEIICKNPRKILEKYNEILEVLSYLPQNNPKILIETSNFLSVLNEIYDKTKT